MAPGTSLLLLTVVMVTSVQKALGACLPDEYKCKNMPTETCIKNTLVDDGHGDCFDFSDEGMHTQCTHALHFACRSGSCIEFSRRYDNIDDCPDTGDEEKYIGDFCNTAHLSFLCERYTTDSECVGMKCACKIGWMNMKYNVCQKRIINDPCSNDADCFRAIELSQCLTPNNTCQCVDGAYIEPSKVDCQMRIIGDNCTQHFDCADAVSNSTCNQTTNLCECNSLLLAGNRNVTCNVHNITDPCAIEAECSNGVENATCVAGQCVCKDGYTPSADNLQCIAAKIGDNCTTDVQCSGSMPHALCSSASKACVCAYGYIPKPDKSGCQQSVVGDNCVTNTDCALIGNSTCDPTTNKCACKAGWLPSANNASCNQNTIGGPCIADSNCNGSLANTSCVGRICTCNTGFVILTASTGCQLPLLGVDPCNGNLTCPTANSYCDSTSGKCVCESGYGPSTDNRMCVQIVLGTTPCTADSNCAGIPNAVCSTSSGAAGVCVCATGYTQQANSCITDKIEESTPASVPCDFICENPWLIPVAAVVGIILTIIAIIILYYVIRMKTRRVRPARVSNIASYKMEPPPNILTIYDCDEGKEPVDNLDTYGIVFPDAGYLLSPPVNHTSELERHWKTISTHRGYNRMGKDSPTSRLTPIYSSKEHNTKDLPVVQP